MNRHQENPDAGFSLVSVLLMLLVLGFLGAHYSQSINQKLQLLSRKGNMTHLRATADGNIARLSAFYTLKDPACGQPGDVCPATFLEPFSCGNAKTAQFTPIDWVFAPLDAGKSLQFYQLTKTIAEIKSARETTPALSEPSALTGLAMLPDPKARGDRFGFLQKDVKHIPINQLNKYLTGSLGKDVLQGQASDRRDYQFQYTVRGLECSSDNYPVSLLVESLSRRNSQESPIATAYYRVPVDIPKPDCDLALSKTVLDPTESSVTAIGIANGVWTDAVLPDGSTVTNTQTPSITSTKMAGQVLVTGITRKTCTNESTTTITFKVNGVANQSDTCSTKVFFNVSQAVLDAECPPEPVVEPIVDAGGGNGTTPSKIDKYAPTTAPALSAASGNPPPGKVSKTGRPMVPTWKQGKWEHVYAD